MPAFSDPTTASGFATTGVDGVGLGVGLVAGTLGVGTGVGVGVEREAELGDAPAPQAARSKARGKVAIQSRRWLWLRGCISPVPPDRSLRLVHHCAQGQRPPLVPPKVPRSVGRATSVIVNASTIR